MKKLQELLKAYKAPITYIIFGILTTIVNIVVYYVCTEVCMLHYLLSNVIAWLLSVLFAFVTNKLFVFESKSWQGKTLFAEIGGFFLARVATGVLDMMLMWLFVDIVQIDEMLASGEMLAKIVVNAIVIILNYVASKLWIFRKK